MRSENALSNGLTVSAGGDLFAGGDVSGGGSGFTRKYAGFGAAPAKPGCGTTPPPPPPPPPPTPTTPTTQTPPPPPPPPGDSSGPPRFDKISLSPTVLRRKTRAKLNYSLTKSTGVRLYMHQQKVGRFNSSTGCKRPTKANRKGKPCTYLTRIKGSRLIRAKAGSNTATITVRFGSTKRVLKPGVYTLTARTTGGDRRQLTFSIRKG